MILVVIKIIDIDYNYFAHGGMYLSGFLLMLLVIVFILTFSWFIRKGPIKFHIKKKQHLENYTLGFVENQGKQQQVSIFTKAVLYIMTALIIYTPFDQLINTPFNFYYYYVWGWMH